ncbi:hypothetical protein SO802_025514 [Lithocarpus litseifolius]|uniref:Aminotransferase-like plant mobile domain-containing protein n=1 Tax=Lithocarpus litseifolius TaxID=425828 RepID=A0AAW2C0M5_9ROSI
MYEPVDAFFVQWIQTMAGWKGSTSTGPLSGREGCLRSYGRPSAAPLFRGRSTWRRPWNVSSNAGVGEVKTDTTISKPAPYRPSVPTSPRPFHALQEECSLNKDILFRFRDRFQFPEETRARLPRKGEKSYAFAHREVYFYEAAFLCGLRFFVHPIIMELLHHLNIAPGQLMPNSWRIFISCMVIWTIIADGDMITLNELVHLYRLRESKEFGYYELVPWDRRSRLIADLPSSFRYWKSTYFFMSVKNRLELESRFMERVHVAIEYASTIEDFDDLVDPRTLARHCLGPEPSHFVLHAIRRKEKKMKTKFNQEFYARIKGKKNEPLSSISQHKLRLTDREKEKEKETTKKGSSTPTLDEGRVASPALSIEEISPHPKKRKTSDKGKGIISASVWADTETALAQANEIITPDEMKEISSVPSYEMVNRHVHKLVQVLEESMHITSQHLASEKKAVIATSKVGALEPEASGLRKDLVVVMDKSNSSKIKIKVLTEELESVKQLIKQKDELLVTAGQKMRNTVAKAICVFQTTDEYNAILFGWYFKGFELLRRYLIKHGSRTDLEKLDFEAVDKEIEADEAAQVAQAVVSTGEDLETGKDDDYVVP